MGDLATTVTVIDACGRAAVPVLLVGDPGTGKSSLIRGVASNEGLLCETVLGSIREPADLAGLPVVTDHGVILDPPAWAKRLADAGAGYLFLDELTTCPDTVQAAMLAVALDRTVGDLRHSRDVRIVAGCNDPILPQAGMNWPRRWRTASATCPSHQVSKTGLLGSPPAGQPRQHPGP